MSNTPAQPFAVVYYSRVHDLLQELQREITTIPLTVRVECLTPEYAGWRAWGVLLTALTGTTIHAAWIAVGKSSVAMLTPYRQGALETTQQALYDRLVEYAKQRGMVVRPGAYEVSSVVFRQSAQLPADLGEGVEEARS